MALAAETVPTAPPWREVELTFTATRDATNRYTDIEAEAEFAHEDGTKIRRADVLGWRTHVPRPVRLDEITAIPQDEG